MAATPDGFDARALPRGGLTRFAPAPTGYLHLGHVANAAWVWRVAAATDSPRAAADRGPRRDRVAPDVRDALLEDLAWLGFVPDVGPIRQSAPEAQAAYAAAAERLRDDGLVLRLRLHPDDVRGVGRRARRGRGAGSGCPGDCRARGLDGPVLRVALGAGSETWMDGLLGPCADEVTPSGDLPIRDRHGHWTYGVLRGGGRPAPGHRPRGPGHGPAPRDAGPDPARAPARAERDGRPSCTTGSSDVPTGPSSPSPRATRACASCGPPA